MKHLPVSDETHKRVMLRKLNEGDSTVDKTINKIMDHEEALNRELAKLLRGK